MKMHLWFFSLEKLLVYFHILCGDFEAMVSVSPSLPGS